MLKVLEMNYTENQAGSVKKWIHDARETIHSQGSEATFAVEKQGTLRIVAWFFLLFCIVYTIVKRSELNVFVITFGYAVTLSLVFASYTHHTKLRFFLAHTILALIVAGMVIIAARGASNGIGIFWMLILPPILMYYYNVDAGLWACLLMLFGLVVLFFSPLRNTMLDVYSSSFMIRFPVIYACDVAVTVLVMLSNLKNKLFWANQDKELENEVKREREKIKDVTLDTIMATWNAMSAKAPEVAAHCERVSKLCVKMAELIGLDEEEKEKLRIMALLHDIGALGVADELLENHGILRDDQNSPYREHVQIGTRILTNLSLMPGIEIGAKYHHERFDGSGYPEGLKGNDIPYAAQLIAVADECDHIYLRCLCYSASVLDHDSIKNAIVSGLETGKNRLFEESVVNLAVEALETQGVY